MLSHPVVLVVMLALVVVLVLAIRSAWRNRRGDFIHRVPVIAGDPEEIAGKVFDRVLPVLVASGFQTVASGGHTTILERRPGLVWPVVIAIVLFPIGLLALLARGSTESVTLYTGANILEVRGYCARPQADYLMDVLDEEAAVYVGRQLGHARGVPAPGGQAAR